MGKVYLNKAENDIIETIGDLLDLAKRTLKPDGYLIVCDEIREMLDGNRTKKEASGLSDEEKKVLGL